MVNRYTVRTRILKPPLPQTLSDEDVIEGAINRATILRPLMTEQMVTDILVDEQEMAYIVDVNWWPHKRDDQI